MNYLLILLCAASAAQQVLTADLLPGTKELFESPIYQQSVAFDAPVIEPEKTLELLKQLLPILPKNINMSDATKDLIGLANYKNDQLCKDYNFEILANKFTLEENPLSSPEGNKFYGPNIQAYIKHFKLKSVEYCKDILKESVTKASNMGLIDEIVRSVLKDGPLPKSSDEYSEIYDNMLLGVFDYLRSSVPDLDKKLTKKNGRKEILAKIQPLKGPCGEILDKAEYRFIVPVALMDKQISDEVSKDEELIKLGARIQICSQLVNIDEASLGGIRPPKKKLFIF